MPEPRMDGTLQEKLLWRIEALREALQEVKSATEPQEAAHQMARNALGVDDTNAERCR